VPPVVTLDVSRLAFSPNGDGVKDTLRATIAVDQPVRLTLEIISERGSSLVYSDAPGSPVGAGTVSFRWNGRSATTAGAALARDGWYILQATVQDATGVRVRAEQRVLVDTHAPTMVWGRHGLTPAILRRGALSLRFRLYDLSPRVQVGVALLDQSGARLKTGSGLPEAPGHVTLRWPKIRPARLSPGAYHLSLSGADGAGNTSTSVPRTFLVEHPVRAHVYARFRGVGRRIALTFDDCNSSAAWGSILNTLERSRIRATFFCPGRQVLANPQLARRTVRDGHAIGSHGWDHANFAKLSFGSALQRLEYDRDVWWRLARVAPTPYFRPPYGAYTWSTIAAAGRAGYGAIVLWDVDAKDWRQPGAAVIESRILSQARPGSIVLMHVLGQTAAMLPSLLKALHGRHFVPVTMPELDALGTPSPGGWRPRAGSGA